MMGTGNELGAQGYAAIADREGIRFNVPPPAGVPNAMMLHVFNINEFAGDVAWIDVRWEGYQHKSAIGDEGDDLLQADDDELFLYIVNWDPVGDPMGAGNPVLHHLDHRQQGGGYVWVKLFQGAYRDYLIESIAFSDKPGGIAGKLDAGEEMARVTVYLRQSPGPTVWWQEQSMEIMSWNIRYYVQ
jgi:hypothetical protein